MYLDSFCGRIEVGQGISPKPGQKKERECGEEPGIDRGLGFWLGKTETRKMGED